MDDKDRELERLKITLQMAQLVMNQLTAELAEARLYHRQYVADQSQAAQSVASSGGTL